MVDSYKPWRLAFVRKPNGINLGGPVPAPMMTNGQTPPNKGRKYPAEVLTPAEVTALISQCSPRAPTRTRALLTLLYRSGLRVSEALALRAGDVNLTTHAVRVLHGKGGKATTRGFHPSADDALARWLDMRRQLGGRGPLFCTLQGGPVSDQYVRTCCTASAPPRASTSGYTRTACGTRSRGSSSRPERRSVSSRPCSAIPASP
jgi:integrase